MRPWEISRLTRYQVAQLYGCDRDANGKPVIETRSAPSRDLMKDFLLINKMKAWMVRRNDK